MTTVKEQSEFFYNNISSRNRKPVKPSTLATYKSYIKNWIVPKIGHLDLAVLQNGEMKKFASILIEAGLSPSMIGNVIGCTKSIMTSAQDENGNCLFARKWNNSFIDAPIIDPKKQKTPTMTQEGIEKSISAAAGQFKTLYCLLAGTGLRIAEAVAIRAGIDDGVESFWIPEESKLLIRGQVYRGKFQTPKTPAGVREVDLAPELNEYMKSVCKEGLLFKTKKGKYIGIRTLYNNAKKDGIPGFHALRRARITFLENAGIPRALVMFWSGHADNNSVHQRYIKLDSEKKARTEWAKKAGLGFKLPFLISQPSEVNNL